MSKTLVTDEDFKAMTDECMVFVVDITRLAKASKDHVIDPYYVNQLSISMMSRLQRMSQYAMGHEDNLLAISAYTTVNDLGGKFQSLLADVRSNQHKLSGPLQVQRQELLRSLGIK